MWKPEAQKALAEKSGFSPLTGINYVETKHGMSYLQGNSHRFSPLTGINYVET